MIYNNLNDNKLMSGETSNSSSYSTLNQKKHQQVFGGSNNQRPEFKFEQDQLRYLQKYRAVHLAQALSLSEQGETL